MTRACLFAALLAILLPVGCGGKKDAGLSGTYEGQPSTRAAGAAVTFQPDGTYTFEGKSAGEVVNGTYKAEGTKLRITVAERNGKRAQGKEAEPATGTLSEDRKSFTLGDVKYRKVD